MNKKIICFSVASALISPLLSAQSSSISGGLEEVVVTARKRVESVQDVPVAISAMSQSTLQKYDVTSLESVAAMNPEFTVGRTAAGSSAQLTIRGIGSSSTSISIEQSVAVIVDDVYYGQGRIINEGMFDMSRVELMKGPQALFFGKNATAGAVSLTTADPSDEFEMFGKVGYEFEAEEKMAEFVVSGPLSDIVKARLALRGSIMDGGYFENKASAVTASSQDLATGDTFDYTYPEIDRDAPQEDEFMGRLTLLAEPTDALSLKLKISGTESENKNPAWNHVVYNSPSGESSLSPGVRIGEKFNIYQNGIAKEIAASLPYADKDGSLKNEYSSEQVTGSITYDFERFTLTSVTNYQKNTNEFVCDCDFQSAPGGPNTTEHTVWEAFSEEIRLQSMLDGPINGMIGVLYQTTDREFDQFVHLQGMEDSSQPDHLRYVAQHKQSSQEGKTLSPFFQVMWEMTPDLELTAGARYTEEEKDSSFVHPYVISAMQALWLPNVAVNESQKFTELTPELVLSWQINDSIMAYGAYKTAYKSGGLSISGIIGAQTTPDDLSFEPETAEGFETGIKSTLFNNQLRLNATAYFYEYKDLQLDFFNSPTFAFVTLNAGSAETKGFELSADFAPLTVPGLNLTAALNYNKATYKDFIAPCWSGQKPSEGCDTTVPGTAGTPGVDISGESTFMAPEWSGSIGVNYETAPFENGMYASLSMNAVYMGDYNPSGFANPHSEMDAYTKFDASLRLVGRDDKWEIGLIGKNLTNEFIVTGVQDGPNTGSGTGTESGVYADQVGFVALPRTLALQALVRF